VDAFSEASKFRPRTAGSGNPGDIGRANAFAIRGRGRGRGRGHGRSIGSGRTSESRSGAYGESVGSTSGGPSEYGTRKGACHTCGETGHYSFECRASDSGQNSKTGARTACGLGWQKKEGREKLVSITKGRRDRNLFC
jgi:Zinc knuckle